MEDAGEKQLKLNQEINYKKQIFLQHRSSLQDAYDNLIKLRSYIHIYNTTIEKVTKEEEHDSNNATNNTLKSIQIKSKIDSKDSLKQQIDSTELIIKHLKSELIIATQHFHSIKTNTTTAASNINNGNIIRTSLSPSTSMSQYDNSNSNSTSLIPSPTPSSSSSSSATVEKYLHIRQRVLDLTKSIDEKETELISLSKQYNTLSNEITQLINTTTATAESSVQPPVTPGINSLLSTGASTGASTQYNGGCMTPINIHSSSSSSSAATAMPPLSPTNTTTNNNTNNTYTSSKTPARGAWVLEGTLSLMDVLTGKIQVYSLLVWNSIVYCKCIRISISSYTCIYGHLCYYDILHC